MVRPFRVRGIVEGFYGPPWSHAARRDVISFVAERGMNAYLYAPKDDPKHRRRWREPYDEAEHAAFVDLAAHCGACGVRFGYAISPGLDIDYDSAPDRSALDSKLGRLVDAGISWFLLALDDIPLSDGLAPRQAGLATWLFDALRNRSADAALAFCPTEYVGMRPSPYLSALGAALPAEVEVMWTGPTVCSPEITAAQASAWGDALGGRPPLLWDNYPVNDGPMTPALHMGPYRGRDADLAEVTSGVLCNPMAQARASKVALATAAEFLLDPDSYDPDESWERAVADVGGPHAAPLMALARACASSPIWTPDQTPAATLVAALGPDGPGAPARSALDEIEVELTAARDLAVAFPSRSADPLDEPDGPEHADDEPEADADTGLAEEIAPWADAASREARVGLSAVALMRAVDDAAGVDPTEVAEPLLHAAFLLLFLWGDARTRTDRIVYGPRFAVHPAIVPLPDGSPGLDVRLALTEDANAIDHLCRRALDGYERWAMTRPVDGA